MGAVRRPTLRDLSSAAQVSLYTASRALGEFDDVAPATRLRVRACADAIGYVPNRVARSLRGNVSQTLGVLTANNANRYYAHLVKALSTAVQPSGYHFVEMDAVEDGIYKLAREQAFVATLIELRVAGVVLTYVPSRESLQTLVRWRMPMVFVDCLPPEGMAHFGSVLPDNYHGSRDVGRHFARLGHRTWMFVGHASGWTSRVDRERGFADAAAECGAGLEVVEGQNDSRSTFEALSAVLAGRARADWPRAIFASNEPLLYGVFRYLREAGMRVPDEVAVAGFDDFDWADAMEPAVTVVDQRIDELGSCAGDLILKAIAGQACPPQVCRPRLIVRRSCGSL